MKLSELLQCQRSIILVDFLYWYKECDAQNVDFVLEAVSRRRVAVTVVTSTHSYSCSGFALATLLLLTRRHQNRNCTWGLYCICQFHLKE